MVDWKPLNGEKTHPLSDAAKKVMRELASSPKMSWEINPGVMNRFQREGLADAHHVKWKGQWKSEIRLTPKGLALVSANFSAPSSTSTPPEDSAPRGGGESGDGLGGGSSE